MRMQSGLAVVAAIFLAVAPPHLLEAQEKPRTTEQLFWSQIETLKGGKVILAACCKICRKGKACGDSCISKSKQCRKKQGCACDG